MRRALREKRRLKERGVNRKAGKKGTSTTTSKLQ